MDLMHEVLKDVRVVETVGYHPVFIMAGRCRECRLPFIPLSYSNQVVGTSEVEFCEDFGQVETFYSCWDQG